MSYNYNCHSFDEAALNNVNSPMLIDNNSIFNGRMKINANQNSSELREVNQFQHAVQFKPNTSGSMKANENSDLGVNDKKLNFSEKLKVLLKYGGNKNDKMDSSDPYAFSDIDQQFTLPVNQPLNNMNSFIKKNVPPNLKLNNVPTQKSITIPKSVIPKLTGNHLGGKEDCNSESKKIFSNMKVAKIAVPVYPNSNSTVTNTNQAMLKMQHTPPADKLKTPSPRISKPSSAQLPFNNKPLVNRTGGKPCMTDLKSPTTLSNLLKLSKNLTGKPQSFGISQVKHPIVNKNDRKSENKKTNFLKSKSTFNQLHKTASLNRSGGKPKRTALGKSVSLDSGMPFTSNLSNKNFQKKSLLEESLLGLKSNAINKDRDGSLSTSVKDKTNASANNKSGSGSLMPVQNLPSTFIPPPIFRLESLDKEKHESLQRIWTIRNKLKGLKREHHHFGLTVNDVEYDENSNSECLLFQNYWFSVSNDYNSLSYHDRRRDTKLSQLKIELRHKIKQLQWRYKDEYRDKMVELLVDSARKQPNLTAFLIRLENSQRNGRKKISKSKSNLTRPMTCSYSDPETGRQCDDPAMPCVRFCQQHITYSNDQLLFTACTALRSDNTTCRAPVLDQTSENPLCLQHKRLEFLTDKPKKLVNAKPVNKACAPRKRSRSSTGGSSRSGRSRKRKRPPPKERKEEMHNVVSSSVPSNDSSSKFGYGKQNDESNDSIRRRNALAEINPQVISKCDIDESQEVEVGEEVLAMAADLPLELATQATRLLEEHDFTNVLNHIPADAFNDLFTEDKEEYEPTPQETEELERALEAVDKDVKSLEKLSQTQGILDTLLDEQTIAQTLAQLPEVSANLEVPPTLVPVFYQNGFTNLNQLEQTLHDVNKSLTQTVLLNPGADVISNHFVTNLTIPNHADVLQS